MNNICGHCTEKKDCTDSKLRVDDCGDYRPAKYLNTLAGLRFKRFYDSIKTAKEPIDVLQAGWKLLEEYRAFRYEWHSKHVSAIIQKMAEETAIDQPNVKECLTFIGYLKEMKMGNVITSYEHEHICQIIAYLTGVHTIQNKGKEVSNG